MTFEISPLEDADIPGAIALWQACDQLRPWNDPRADIAQARNSGSAQFFVGKIGRDIVASTLAGDDGHRGWLYYVSVHPNHRGLGFGRQIVAAAENWLKSRGVAKTQLMIVPTMRACVDSMRPWAMANKRVSRWPAGLMAAP